MNERELAQRVDALSLREQIGLLAGSATWLSLPLPEHDIPAIKLCDGPNAARGDAMRGVPAASFPVGSAMAATWHPELIERVGVALAEEARTKDVQVLLGPTINLQRHPLGGRNFECYSEDPLLSGLLAIAFIRGVQSEGVAACAKHFVCNDAEFERHSLSSDLDERTLRELYLRPFEMAVTEADVWTVMSAYNRINGRFASSHEALLRHLLKGDWGFDGVVVSDWGAALETVDNANGGLDLEMPGPTRTRGAKLERAVDEGQVAGSVIRDSALRMLRLIDRTGKFQQPEPRPEQAVDRVAHRDLARAVAGESMVLLKNEPLPGGSPVLPLLPHPSLKIAVIGPNATPGQIQGGGSSAVIPHYQITPLQGLRAVYDNVEHVNGCNADKYIPVPAAQQILLPGTDEPGLRLRLYNSDDGSGTPALERSLSSRASPWGFIPIGRPGREDTPFATDSAFSARIELDYLPDISGPFDVGLQSAGLSRLYLDDNLLLDNWLEQTPGDGIFGGGSSERRAQVQLTRSVPVRVRIEFRSVEHKMLLGVRFGIAPQPPADDFERAIAVAAAAAADAAIIITGSNPDWETEGNDRADMNLPGAQDALIAAVIGANPRTAVVLNTGSAMTMPWFDQAPAVLQAWLPGQEFGHALGDILSGARNPSGRLPTTFYRRCEDAPSAAFYPGRNGVMRYDEGLQMGYRGLGDRTATPLAAFGHGLSYTAFEYRNLTAGTIDANGQQTFLVTVRNCGDRAGTDLVQLYLTGHPPGVDQPPLKLAGFARITLEPGAEQRLRIAVRAREFQYWDCERSRWRTPSGCFELRLGRSAAQLLDAVSVTR